MQRSGRSFIVAGINPGRGTCTQGVTGSFAPLTFITGHTLQFMSGDAFPDVSVKKYPGEKPEHACLSMKLAQRGINSTAYLGTRATSFTGKRFPPVNCSWVPTSDLLHAWHSTSMVPAQIQHQIHSSPSTFGKTHKCNSSFFGLTFLQATYILGLK